MTMHITNPGLTTLNTRLRKKNKITKSRLSQLQAELKEYNKLNKRLRLGSVSLDEYIDIANGKKKYTKSFTTYTPAKNVLHDRAARDRAKYPSHGPSTTSGSCAKKQAHEYSGERKLLGVAAMHKSNLVPVFDEESARELARMRR